MIRRWFLALPGPTSVRLVVAATIVIVALIALFFIYDFVGNRLLDTGGTVG